MKRPRIITFDCYGTLIDWNAGISQALIAEGKRQGFHTDREMILDVYHDAEMQVESEHYRTYREILGLLEKEIATQLAGQPQHPLAISPTAFRVGNHSLTQTDPWNGLVPWALN